MVKVDEFKIVIKQFIMHKEMNWIEERIIVLNHPPWGIKSLWSSEIDLDSYFWRTKKYHGTRSMGGLNLFLFCRDGMMAI